jgi:hypothetical protein
LEEDYLGAEATKAPWFKEGVLSGQRNREYMDHRLEWMIKSDGIEVIAKGFLVASRPILPTYSAMA